MQILILVIIFHGPLLLLALDNKYRDPEQNIRYHFVQMRSVKQITRESFFFFFFFFFKILCDLKLKSSR